MILSQVIDLALKLSNSVDKWIKFVKFYGGIYPSSRNSLKIHEQAADVLRFTKKKIAVANLAVDRRPCNYAFRIIF